MAGNPGVRLKIDAKDVEKLHARFGNADQIWEQIVRPELTDLGNTMVRAMRSELELVHYTGALEKSVRVVIEVSPKRFSLEVGPTAEHRYWVAMGTRPHWAPIAPLRRWCAMKLGDENAAWAVQRSIAKFGTSRFAEMLYGTKGNAFYYRTFMRSDVTSARRRFVERVQSRIAKRLQNGK